MHQERVLHVLRQALQEAERLVEDHWHCNLGELLEGQTTRRSCDRKHHWLLSFYMPSLMLFLNHLSQGFMLLGVIPATQEQPHISQLLHSTPPVTFVWKQTVITVNSAEIWGFLLCLTWPVVMQKCMYRYFLLKRKCFATTASRTAPKTSGFCQTADLNWCVQPSQYLATVFRGTLESTQLHMQSHAVPPQEPRSLEYSTEVMFVLHKC